MCVCVKKVIEAILLYGGERWPVKIKMQCYRGIIKMTEGVERSLKQVLIKEKLHKGNRNGLYISFEWKSKENLEKNRGLGRRRKGWKKKNY